MSGKDTEKSSTVSRSSMANRRQDRRSKVGAKSKSSRSNAAPHPKNHLAWYVAINSKPFREKIFQIPHIKWKCPPKFALNTEWHVAAGEGSQEGEAQTCRETKLPEIVYPHLSAIPPSSPFSPLGTEDEFCGNIPFIPIVPIEETEETAETTFDTSISGNHTLHIDGDKSLPDILRGLESGDMEVAAAAAATVAAVMERKEQIDTQLLVKFLTDPEMIKKLIDKDELRSESGFVNPPGPIANTSSPPSSSTPASVTDKITNELSEPLGPTIPTLSGQCIQDGINVRSAPGHTSKPVTESIPLPRFHHSDVARSDTCQIAGAKQAKPIIPSTSKPDEVTINRLVNKYRPPMASCLNPSTSIPNMAAIKKMINQYGAPKIEKFRKPNLGVGHPFLGPRPLLSASSCTDTAFVMPPRVNPNTGICPIPQFSGVNIPAPPPVDLNYFKSLIKQHGQNHETKELPKSGQQRNFEQGLRLGHNTTSIEMNQRYQKPCVYFNSLKGCKNGDKCLYRHDGGVVEVPLAKRMRFG